MRLLILSFYFRPDLSAGSFRTTALVKALRAALPAGSHIDVLTTRPNRYGSFSASAEALESEPGITVRRIDLPAHRSDMLGQSLAFLRYARGVLQAVRGQQYDLVFATSGRLMTAALGALVAGRVRAPLYLDIRDIFVDTIKDVLPRPAALLAKPVFAVLERWTMRRAARINLVSEGFRAYFERRYPGQSLAWFTNGIDDEFLGQVTARSAPAAGRPLEILYAGNIGEGQGLHAIVPGLATRLKGRARLTVIGDGGRMRQLQDAVRNAGVEDVVALRGPVPRARLLEEYRQADVLFLHLNAFPAFEKVLPSKIFEYAALGKPILAGVAGFAAEFLRREVDNAAVFEPCDAVAGERAFDSLRIEDAPREAFVNRFARDTIARAMAADLLATARERNG